MERVIGDDDLLEEILLRLPAEIVHGFIPVSKHWCNLISSQSFRRRHGTSHLRLPNSNSKILMIDQSKGSATSLLDVRNGVTVIKTSNIDSDKLLSSIQPFYKKLLQKVDEPKEIEFKICDAYNGLFLFSLSINDRGRNLFSLGYQEGDYYLVCNPLTKEYHELPRSTIHTSRFQQVAFAPTLKPYGYYKVILLSLNLAPPHGRTDFIVQVYSSETSTWKELGHMMDDCLYDSRYVVWGNCLLVIPKNNWRGSVSVLDSERLHVSNSSPFLPSFIEKNLSYHVHYFGESGRFFYVIAKYLYGRGKNHYTLWEMEGVDGSWKKKFQFKTEKAASILYVHREGEHVWLLMLKAGTVYYILDGNTERLEAASDIRESYYWRWNMRSYTPTLFPLGV